MISSTRSKASLACGALLVLSVATNGCGDDNPITAAQSAVCCTEFKPGASIDASIGGGAQAQVAAQAVADFSGIASTAVDDITTSCRSMAQQLDAPPAEQTAAEANTTKRARMDAWCQAAVRAIGVFRAQAGGTLTVDVVPPACDLSVTAKGNCQAKCSGTAQCDLKANPPRCTGGSLQIACKGACTANARPTVRCEGSCSAACNGSCTAQGGVQCTGRCDGACNGAAQGGTGTGIRADGTCDGTCNGTCEVTAPGVTCNGSCNGECSGTCTGSANASVVCDGTCAGDFEPIKCEGGKLEGGCQTDAQCDANCDASVSAKAECTPPSVRVTVAGAANIQAAGKLQAVFETNLGLIYAFRARLEGMADLTGTITGNADVIIDIKAACIPSVIAAATDGVQDVQASVNASASIVTAAQ